MSDSEKDAVIGRAVLEEKRLRSDLALLDKRLSDIGEALGELKYGIKTRSDRHPELTDLPIPGDLAGYTDLSRIVDLVRDRRTMYDKLKEAEQLLVRLGIREAPIVISSGR